MILKILQKNVSNFIENKKKRTLVIKLAKLKKVEYFYKKATKFQIN